MRVSTTIGAPLLLALSLLPSLAHGGTTSLYRSHMPLGTSGSSESLGVNIHFTHARPGELERMAAAGFRWVRMDFAWEAIEKVHGVYDFTDYDGLMAQLDRVHIRPILILDYGNALYGQGAPATSEARAAFSRFAAAAAVHFKGRGILWEMWNEPNGGFWKPKANVTEYVQLALETARAIRAAAPDEWLIGPATSGIDTAFLEACFRAGLLRFWDAVSVHPYRTAMPEGVEPEYEGLRALIARYAPEGKGIPIINGEWGYSEKYTGLDRPRQGYYAARQALTNIGQGIPVSIWYDWHDDGESPTDPEHHFGLVTTDYRAKPSYVALSTLARTLRGVRFNKRIALDKPTDHCAVYSGPGGVRYAVWTTDRTAHEARLPITGQAIVVEPDGERRSVQAGAGGLSITLSEAPLYVEASAGDRTATAAAEWPSAPRSATIRSQRDLENVLAPLVTGRQGTVSIGRTTDEAAGAPCPSRSARLSDFRSLADAVAWIGAGRASGERSLRISVTPVGASVPITQTVRLKPAFPVTVVPLPAAGGRLALQAAQADGPDYQGEITIRWSGKSARFPVSLSPQRRAQVVTVPGDPSGPIEFEIHDMGLAAECSQYVTVPLADPDLRALKALPDGDAGVGSVLSTDISDQAPPLAVAAPSVHVRYAFEPGWKFARLQPVRPIALPERFTGLGVWVWSDGSTDSVNVRYRDAAGQTFQPASVPLSWKGWQFVRFPAPSPDMGHWGGRDDGIPRGALVLDTPLLVDSTRQGTKGHEFYAAGWVAYAAATARTK